MLTYTLKVNARSRRIRLAVKADGSCVVTVPKGVPRVVVDRFVKDQQAWITAALDKVKTRASPYAWKGTAAELKKYKSSALRLVKSRLNYFNRVYGFKIGAISIRNQQTRWGSCSSTGRLSFTYKLCLLPPHLADYVIVHELCHLGEMNHSAKFWALMAKTLPNAGDLRKELNGR